MTSLGTVLKETIALNDAYANELNHLIRAVKQRVLWDQELDLRGYAVNDSVIYDSFVRDESTPGLSRGENTEVLASSDGPSSKLCENTVVSGGSSVRKKLSQEANSNTRGPGDDRSGESGSHRRTGNNLIDSGQQPVLGKTMGQSSPAHVSRANPWIDLEEVRGEIGECTRCALHKNRNKLVFGEGSARARLMFIGEAPGAAENMMGKPLVGPAGALFSKILVAIGLSRDDIYLCNIVKCCPPDGRFPFVEEMNTCSGFLDRQITIVNPEVIVTLGQMATQFLLKQDAPITELRGGFIPYKGAKVMPTFHPGYLLKKESAKRPVWEDMKMVRDLLAHKKKR